MVTQKLIYLYTSPPKTFLWGEPPKTRIMMVLPITFFTSLAWGQIKVDGNGLIQYSNIESIPGFEATFATIASSLTINEGDNVTLVGSATPGVISGSNSITIVSAVWILTIGAETRSITITLPTANNDGSVDISTTLDWDALSSLGVSNDGVYVLTLEVTDSAGTVANDSTTLIVNNIEPTVSIDQPSSFTFNEGDNIQFEASASDPSSDTLTYSWNFGDETIVNNVLQPLHTYEDDGEYEVIFTVKDDDSISIEKLYLTINNVDPIANAGDDITITEGSTFTLTVTDNDGASNSDQLVVTVNNLSPQNVNAGDDQTIDEGDSLAFAGSFDDPGILDTHTIVWDFGDGNSTTGTLTPTHTYTQNGDYTVTLTITDEQGASASDTLSVTVTELPIPQNVEAGSIQVGNEGEAMNFNGSFTLSKPMENYTIEWNFGDGSASVFDTLTPSHIYSEGIYSVTFTVTDNNSLQSNSDTVTVYVNNVAPSLIISGDDSVNEGGTYTLTLGTITDPGQETLISYTIDWGDGNTETILVEELNSDRTITHLYEDDNNPTILVSLTDEEGTYNNVASKSVTVNNVAPSLEISGDEMVDEESVYTLTLGEVNDPGNDTVTNYIINWGDGNIKTILAEDLNSDRTVTHIYNNGDTNPTILVSLTDEDGSYDVASKSITVNNVIPDISIDDIVINRHVDDNNVAVFTISLDQSSNETVTLDFTTLDGTAIAGLDYTQQQGQLIFTPGQTTQTVTVPFLEPLRGDINGDGEVNRTDFDLLLATRREPFNSTQNISKTFSLSLTNIQGGSIVDSSGLATFSYDPRDLNNDGEITLLDIRLLGLLL